MKCAKGFTLIEVLIAAIILFTALAIIADIFKGSTLLANKASETARMYQVHPTAISAIKSQLKDKVKVTKAADANGQIIIFGVEYNWQAQRVVFNSPPPDSISGAEYPNVYGIYDVTVEAKLGEKIQDFTFKAATW